MKVGLQVNGEQVSIAEVVAFGKAAEAAGFDTVWSGEAWRDGFVPLAAVAVATTRIGLGTNIAQWTRTLPNLDLATGDLQELSNGRFTLGLGPMPKEWNEEWHGISYEQPLRRMREYVTALRLLRTASLANPVTFEGDVFTIRNYIRFNGPLAAPPPTLLAVTRFGMARLAGEIADGVMLNSIISNEYAREVVLPMVDEGARAAGRTVADLHIVGSPITAVAETTERARDLARHQLAFYAGVVPYIDGVARFYGRYDEVMAAKAAFWRNPLEAVALIPDDLVEKMTVYGTPDEVRDQIGRFEGYCDEVSLVTPSFMLDHGAIREGHEAIIDAFRR